MRFFPSSSLTGANRPRSRSSATSSSSSSIIDADMAYGQGSSTTYSPTQPPPPTRTTTGLPPAQSFRVLVPTVSPEMNLKATSTETNRRSTDPQPMQTNPSPDPSTSCTAYLYSTFPPEIFKEVETYDRRQANQTTEPPLHYFSDNKHAQKKGRKASPVSLLPSYALDKINQAHPPRSILTVATRIVRW
ncbi:hypothetical protein QFC22_005824 [Naganishia vaughanmartiniae]|uniref:Uncharacterized protein n=1 Tax=Naganishia vaughanmartiniae TaxID=1424756 RepID=A0ACC2WRG3_9TREE|nr:hypothetical protein QFC22_005824 [Naganishia vaughanmartiniae]